jgi:hypothetical protein
MCTSVKEALFEKRERERERESKGSTREVITAVPMIPYVLKKC